MENSDRDCFGLQRHASKGPHPMNSMTPIFTSIEGWREMSGMSPRATYDAIGRGDLKAIKVGTRTLIDVEPGLAWLRSRPAAKIRPQIPPSAPRDDRRRQQVEPADTG